MTTEHFYNEIDLTISNTEYLYKEALKIKDFSPLGDQITDLAYSTVHQMKVNGVDLPVLHTDHDVRDMHEKIAKVASRLQGEAKQ